jgi:hypothetical protein
VLATKVHALKNALELEYLYLIIKEKAFPWFRPSNYVFVRSKDVFIRGSLSFSIFGMFKGRVRAGCLRASELYAPPSDETVPESKYVVLFPVPRRDSSVLRTEYIRPSKLRWF